MYINISETAQEYFRELLSSRQEETSIRIFVTDPGTAFAECGIAYCTKDDMEDEDTVLEYPGFSVVVDEQSWPFLEDTEINYINDGESSSLTLKAPNAKMQKLDKDAPLLERVNYLIQSVINPQLATHGGNVTLIDIKEEHAILKFGGGCNGCSMLDVTLIDGVEKQIIETFPDEIVGVRDITDHVPGSHSYY